MLARKLMIVSALELVSALILVCALALSNALELIHAQACERECKHYKLPKSFFRLFINPHNKDRVGYVRN